MTLIILSFLSKKKNSLLKSKLLHLFLILIAMLISSSASPQVIADFTTLSANSGCGSLVVEFQDLSTGSPDTWLWDFGNGNSSTLKNPIAIYVNPGTYDVTLTIMATGSSDIKFASGLIKVFKNPIAELAANSPVNGCMPLAVSFEDLSFTNNPLVNWQWDFGDGGGSSLQHPNYNYTTDGNFSVSLMVSDINGCESLSTEFNIIHVDKEPIANFIADNPFSCSSNELVSFTNNTLGTATYVWGFGDGNTSTQPNPTHNYSTGLYSVMLSATVGSCTDTLVLSNYIEVGAELNSEFTIDVNSGCENLFINFSDITSNDPDSWLWDFGDGTAPVQASLQNPSHYYSNAGIFDVTLTTSKAGECVNSYTFLGAVEVYSKPDIHFTADTAYGCTIPFLVEFSDQTINAISWQWNFNNGVTSMLKNPSILYGSYGTYDVNLTVKDTNGCIDTKVIPNVIDIEEIIIEISATEFSGCVPFDVSFIDTTNSIRPLVDWDWAFGDGNFSNIQNPAHEYIASGVFDISLSATNDYGCVANAEFSAYINATDPPQVDFEAVPFITCVGQDVVFSDVSASSSLFTNWEWDFGDGSISNIQNPIYQYQLTGSYSVTLIAGINNCRDTFEIANYIEIIEPTAIFTEKYSCDNPLTVEFENLSIGDDNVFWDFGDGSFSNQQNPIHTYLTKGDYDVALSVNNISTGCTHEFIKPIRLTIPKANFDYLNSNIYNTYEDSVGCLPHAIYLDNLAEDWDWYKVIWSDGYIGYGRMDHTFTEEGIFDVTMIVTDIHGCKDTMTYNNMYRINDVKADFRIVNVLGCDSMLVNFEDLSIPSSSVVWDFGDTSNSILNNPQHIYYAEGFYDVTLYAESADGCKDTLQRLEYIQFQYPTADFSSNIQGVCPKDDVQFTNLSDGIGINSSWDFGDGTQSSQINPLHSFITNGIYDISLLITDSFGCPNSLLLPNHIEVLKPTANFITTGVSSNCPPLISTFSNLSTSDVTSWEWRYSDGGNSLVSDPSHLFATSGSFDVSLIVINEYGCKDTLVQNGLIDISGPTGSFSISDTLICKDDSILFIPSVSNTDLFLWDFGNGVLSADSFPSQIYTIDGIFLPSLIIENTSGCQFTINNSDTITVRSVSVEAGINIEICEGEQVQLNATGNATQFTWTPAIMLSNPNLSNPIANPTADIMYYVHHFDDMCNATDSVFVQVNNEIPSPTFTTINHCEGDTIQFSANSGLPTTNISWVWSFGSSIQNPLQQLTLGTSNIQLIAINLDNNCSDTLVQQVEVHPLPEAEFTILEICLGEMSNFLNTSSGNIVSWEYNMGDGVGISFLENPTYTYTTNGIFYPNVVVTSDFGCTDEFITTVEVNEFPLANFLVENNCEGEWNTFTDISTILNGSIISWEFIFGDESLNGNLSTEQHQYASAGTYNVTLNIISDKGCESSIVKESKVYDTPLADFSSEQYCLGIPTYFSDFSTLNNGNIIQWEWVFGDGVGVANFENPTYVFANPGTYVVSLLATTNFGCTSSSDKNITIAELPIVNFITEATVCLGEEVHFSDLSISSNTIIVSWEWNLGDGTIVTIQNPSHEYKYVQTFDVTLEVVSDEGCMQDTTIVNAVEVFSNPVADFNASTYNTTELSSEINFYNNSSGDNSYFWNFDNGITSSELNPTIDFLDIRMYDVILHVISADGCEGKMIKTINISPEFTLHTPNTFTPNGDGNNDIFLTEGNGVTSFKMQVFDRWGGLVFESSDIEYGWNGLDASANIVGTGKYMYHISLYDYNGKLWVYNGELNLMR